MIDRRELARQLVEASRLMDVLDEDRFRARAYANAARGIEAFEGDVEELLGSGEATRIPGVGQGIAAEIAAAVETGVLPALADLRHRVPEGVRELFRVSGLGPGKVRALWRAGILDLEALIAAIDRGEVQKLKGFGAKSASAIREAAAFAAAARASMCRHEAEAVRDALAAELAASAPQGALVAVGAYRRGLEVVDVLELLAVDVPLETLETFARSALADAHAAGGTAAATGASSDAAPAWLVAGSYEGKRVCIGSASSSWLGVAQIVATGDGEYVRWLATEARGRGLRLDASGLWRGDRRVETPTERDALALLEVPWVEPERREGAAPEPVPGLIRDRDVRGVVHNHSTWSDAAHSIREMVTAARAQGYAYLAMADHSKSSFYANGLSEDRVMRQAEEIRAIRAELAAEGSEFELLHGIEVDILADGSLDFDASVLELLDYAVVSVHQHFTLSEAEQTARIVRAVASPYADILGHATGRLLLRRPAYPLDLHAVIEACAESGTVIEINANPRRLDLDWRWARVARERGCLFSIDPDAHDVAGIDDIRHGVTVARRAGLTAGEVVNTAPTGREFLRRLKRSNRP